MHNNNFFSIQIFGGQNITIENFFKLNCAN